MNHGQLKQWVSSFLDDEANDEQRREVLSHLESCVECRTLVSEAKMLRDDIRRMADVDLPPTFAYGVLRTVRNDQEQVRVRAGIDRFGMRMVLALSLIVVCLFGFGSLYQPELPSPVDRILTGELSDSLSKRVLEPQRDISKDDIIFAAISK
jgi:anti-sigma factor RsiW